ncbi:Altered inheritance rate of mitochondria protein 25 [Coccomyxa sp. Obi]|nr:Altered inheritance rate of mitochondria protein 25 [Coccomyxa sp. Obi]
MSIRPSSVVETDAQLPEQASQSDSREITQTNEGKPSDVQIAAAVDHPALIITRDIEWGTVILGFEQANRYTVLDQDGNVVALMAEDMGSIGTAIGRQLLRTRRSFTATVFSPDGSQVIFRVRRPVYLINSTIIVEDGEGNLVGEVHQRWHLWKRKYDLYLERNQFASIEGNFLAWEFVLRDQDGGVLALIDRNFQGFGKELFTDAGKYVIHFGSKPAEAAEQAANTIAAAHPDKPPPKVTALARLRTDVQVVPTQTGNQLEVVRPLVLDERMTALAAAISIDYDYFSQHSHGPGMMPGFLFPMPIPTPSYPEPEAAPGADAGDIGAGDAAEAGPSPAAAGSGDAGGGAAAEPLDRDLGSDSFEAPDGGSGDGGDSWWGQDDDSGGGAGDGEGGSLWGDISGFFSDD